MPENKKKNYNPGFDRVIHEPARLQIVSYLATAGKPVVFTELQDKLNLSAGNLSVQLKRLEKAGYVSIAKSFRDNRPLTTVSLNRSGMDALKDYLHELELMIDGLKDAMPAADMQKGKAGE